MMLVIIFEHNFSFYLIRSAYSYTKVLSAKQKTQVAEKFGFIVQKSNRLCFKSILFLKLIFLVMLLIVLFFVAQRDHGQHSLKWGKLLCQVFHF